MADDNALRSLRKRKHAAGDHSLCRRCSAVLNQPRRLAPVPDVTEGLEGDHPFDPKAEMRNLAARLVAAHTADPSNSMLARELRMTLSELMPKGGQDADADLTGLFSALQA